MHFVLNLLRNRFSAINGPCNAYLWLVWESVVLSSCPSLQLNTVVHWGFLLRDSRFTFSHRWNRVASPIASLRSSASMEILKFFSESHLKDKVLSEPKPLAYYVQRLNQIRREFRCQCLSLHTFTLREGKIIPIDKS
jgi:hypothetical protein